MMERSPLQDLSKTFTHSSMVTFPNIRKGLVKVNFPSHLQYLYGSLSKSLRSLKVYFRAVWAKLGLFLRRKGGCDKSMSYIGNGVRGTRIRYEVRGCGTSDPLSRCVNKSNKTKCIWNDAFHDRKSRDRLSSQ